MLAADDTHAVVMVKKDDASSSNRGSTLYLAVLASKQYKLFTTHFHPDCLALLDVLTNTCMPNISVKCGSHLIQAQPMEHALDIMACLPSRGEDSCSKHKSVSSYSNG